MDRDLKAAEDYGLEKLKEYLVEHSGLICAKREYRRRVVYSLAQKIADQFQNPDLIDRLEFVMHEYIDDLKWDAKNIH